MTTSENENPLTLPLQQTLGDSLVKSISESKILLIGSGGIGCELLKNLALSGFRYVDVIDLDTIDVSNLNRQFLFRSHHVGKSKCEVACDVAQKMAIAYHDGQYNAVKFTPHHGNVKDKERFGVNFFKQFHVVLNALDNVDARRHVNRLCLASGVPLIEAGTTGYLGQVTVIHKESSTECYECQPKPTQKVYPICTIRSTPSQPVHTIVWAKELYKLMFGSKPENSMLFEDDTINDQSEDENGGEKSIYMDTVINQRPNISSSLKDIQKYAHDVIVALYHSEIQKQLDMDRYKTAQKTPKALDTDLIQKTIDFSSDSDKPAASPTRSANYKSTHIWSTEESLAEFIACLEDVYYQATPDSTTTPTYDDFDKDDFLAMRFVTAASNLRSFVFQIDPLQSLYSAKGIAGNIIPAIATTNAIVAGLQILNVFKILAMQQKRKLEQNENETNNESSSTTINVKEDCKYVYCLREKTRKGYYIQPTSLPSPNPQCFVCRGAKIDLTLNCSNWTLQDFVEKIIKKRLGFVEPTILIGDDGGDIIHEEGEGADTESYAVNLKKTLVQLPAGGIHGKVGDMVRIEDFSQNLEVDVCVWHREEWDDEEEGESDGFFIGGEGALLKDKKKESNEKKDENGNQNETNNDDGDDDDDIICMDEDVECLPTENNKTETNNTETDNGKKRARSEIEGDESEDRAKKSKMEETPASEEDAIVIE